MRNEDAAGRRQNEYAAGGNGRTIMFWRMKNLEMTVEDAVVMALLRAVLSGSPVDDGLLEGLTAAQWLGVFRQSVRQGVSAMIFDALSSSPAAAAMPKRLALKWMAVTVAVEDRYDRQKAVGGEIARLLAAEGLSVPVLKGLALACLYPRPEHRECGDIDIYSGERHSAVDAVLAGVGADVEDDYYIHSHISFKGVTIENHRFFNQVRGSRSRKELERHFVELMNGGLREVSPSCVPGTMLGVPPPDFTVLFLTAHALKHFVAEGGIRLRHLADWAVFLKTEQDNVDWAQFYLWADKMHFSRFADALTALSVSRLGLELTAAGLRDESRYADAVLEDILHPGAKSGEESRNPLLMRLNLACSAFRSLWKYHAIYRKSAFLEVFNMAAGLIFDRNPKL